MTHEELLLDRSQLYTKLALKMTEWEMHRTQSQFEAQLIYKNFLFQFFNYYAAILYIAFFKGKFVGYPGHYSTFLGLRNESVRAQYSPMRKLYVFSCNKCTQYLFCLCYYCLLCFISLHLFNVYIACH